MAVNKTNISRTRRKGNVRRVEAGQFIFEWLILIGNEVPRRGRLFEKLFHLPRHFRTLGILMEKARPKSRQAARGDQSPATLGEFAKFGQGRGWDAFDSRQNHDGEMLTGNGQLAFFDVSLLRQDFVIDKIQVVSRLQQAGQKGWGRVSARSPPTDSPHPRVKLAQASCVGR